MLPFEEAPRILAGHVKERGKTADRIYRFRFVCYSPLFFFFLFNFNRELSVAVRLTLKVRSEHVLSTRFSRFLDDELCHNRTKAKEREREALIVIFCILPH